MARAAGLAALLAACATFVPYRGPAEWTAPPVAGAETALDLAVAGAGLAEGESSSFRALVRGDEALGARLALAGAAGRSLDVQTYIWDLDTSGGLLLGRLLAAADRGVRVRLLIDDTAIHAHEREWLAVDAHRAVEVRAFNPFRLREPSYAEQLVDFVTDFARLNRRLHAKLFVADGGFLVAGGRNVADDYFVLDPEANFRDLDLLGAGAIARAAAAEFDRYWNSGWAVPVSALGGRRSRELTLEEVRRRCAAAERRAGAAAAPPGTGWLRPGESPWIAAPGWLVGDDPGRAARAPAAPAWALRSLAESAGRTVDVEVAYLILSASELDVVRHLAARGIRVRILTNSLATNDVVAAHAGYAATRRALLEAGVELHELRPDGTSGGPTLAWRAPSGSRASLHSKLVVVDGRTLLVGSMNLDPRSLRLNHEVALVVESEALGRELVGFLETGFDPAASWRVVRRAEVEPGLAGEPAGERPVWIERGADGSQRLRRREPEAGPGRRALARFLRWLPIEGQL